MLNWPGVRRIPFVADSVQLHKLFRRPTTWAVLPIVKFIFLREPRRKGQPQIAGQTIQKGLVSGPKSSELILCALILKVQARFTQNPLQCYKRS